MGAVTFHAHPASLLAPEREPEALTRLDDKIALLLAAGADFVVVLTLSRRLLGLTPTQFVDSHLVAGLGVRAVVVGPNFRFGRGASGDPSVLSALGDASGFDVAVPDLIHREDGVVSSTRIRAELKAGELQAAASLLGRCHFVRARVVATRGTHLTLSLPKGVASPVEGTFLGAVSPARANVLPGLGAPYVLRLADRQVHAVPTTERMFPCFEAMQAAVRFISVT
ncbi:hypothetical protein GCM10023339_40390 [Alloalcanivorax gelatiniphagus]